MKRILLVVLAALFGVALTACADGPSASDVVSQPGADALTAERLLDDDQGFVLPGLTWGMTPEELDALPGYSLGERFGNSVHADAKGREHTYTTYQSDRDVSFEGHRGSISYQFQDGHLIDSTITFQKNLSNMSEDELVALYDAAVAQARKAFGEPDIAGDDQQGQAQAGDLTFRLTSTYRVWAKTGSLGDTKLNISRGGRDGATSRVSISLSCMETTATPKETTALSLSEMLDATQGFTLPGLAWGMSPEALDALPTHALGTELGRNSYADAQGREHVNAAYLSDSLVRVEGNWGRITYQFIDDALIDVSMTFKTNLEQMKDNDLDALYDAATAWAESAVGAPIDAKDAHRVEAEIEDLQIKYTITSRTWVKAGSAGETRLHVSKSTGTDGETTGVSIAMSCVDPSLLQEPPT